MGQPVLGAPDGFAGRMRKVAPHAGQHVGGDGVAQRSAQQMLNFRPRLGQQFALSAQMGAQIARRPFRGWIVGRQPQERQRGARSLNLLSVAGRHDHAGKQRGGVVGLAPQPIPERGFRRRFPGGWTEKPALPGSRRRRFRRHPGGVWKLMQQAGPDSGPACLRHAQGEKDPAQVIAQFHGCCTRIPALSF